MSESNICPQCGGVIRLEYTITFERCTPKEMRVGPDNLSLNPSPFKLCPGHPDPTSKHDGSLSGHSSVEYYALKDRTWIRLCEGGETWVLSPAESLSLLSWLQQEKPMLEKLQSEWKDE